MDDLDRLYRRLVHNIRATRPEYLKIPFTVRELYEQMVPYRHNRRELAIETNDDYETAVARLLSGERDYLTADPELQESLRREIASPTGDPGIFKDHADATVTLTAAAESALTPVPATAGVGMTTPDTLPRHTEAAPRTEMTPGQSAMAAFDAMSPGASAPEAANTSVPSLLESLSPVEMPTGCRFCSGTLPEDRETNFCPHCGENLRTRRCPACGSEMDMSWKFCVTCGRATG
ncbi:MAG: zinc ribbon domain-containing protein [Gemmatimonadaceae bacterium]